MRKYINKIFITVLVVAMSLTSCEVTDLQPVDSLSETLAYSTPQNIELSMIGVYDAAQSGFYLGSEANDRGYIFGAAHIQQGDMRGEDFLLINIFYAFTYQSTITTTTANNVEYWNNGFRLINLCNLFIEGVQAAAEQGIVNAEVAASYEGEARVLRAMAYHTLLIHFARPYLDGNGANPGLPIYTVGINGADKLDAHLTIGRSTVSQVYDFILADLNFAENALAATRTDGHQITRATKGAAIALKSRVYLHMGDYANVVTETGKLVGQTVAPFSGMGYSLGAEVDEVWAANGYHDEMIFGMEMATTDNLNTNAALARMLGSPSEGARGEYAISPIIWTQPFWHADDLRRSLLVLDNGERYYIHKYRDYVNWTDVSPIVRYPEVLLNRAEALARLNGLSAEALNLVNAIRDRAVSGSMTSYTLGDFASGTELVGAILNEKRIELLGEGHRWSEIHRLATDPNFSTGGIPAKPISADITELSDYDAAPTSFGVPAIPYSDYRFLWPLPNDEVVRNPTLAAQQNPGY